jgi:hypothetical protein
LFSPNVTSFATVIAFSRKHPLYMIRPIRS